MLTILAIAIAPILLFLAYIYSRDHEAKERLGLLVLSFVFGFAAMFILFYLPFPHKKMPWAVLTMIYNAFVLSAIPEELSKYILLLIGIHLIRKNTWPPIAKVVLAVFISMGFACIENILYIWPQGWLMALQRALLSVPAHFLFAIVMGYYVAVAPRNQWAWAWALGIPIVLHGIFNLLLQSVAYFAETRGIWMVFAIFLFFLFDIALWILAFVRLQFLEQRQNQQNITS